jgi:hypothetical protein
VPRRCQPFSTAGTELSYDFQMGYIRSEYPQSTLTSVTRRPPHPPLLTHSPPVKIRSNQPAFQGMIQYSSSYIVPYVCSVGTPRSPRWLTLDIWETVLAPACFRAGCLHATVVHHSYIMSGVRRMTLAVETACIQPAPRQMEWACIVCGDLT